MPPKSTKAGQKRARGKSAASESGPPAKKPATAREAEVTGAQASTSNAASPIRRIPKGPNGETLMPQIMPVECHEIITKIPMPGSWVRGIDATPGREVSLGSRPWWDVHGPWLEANKTKLKLSAANWKMRETAQDHDPLEEDEGNDDWDFVCVARPRAERIRDEDDEEDDEDEDDEDDDDEEGEDESECDDEDEDNGNYEQKKAAAKAKMFKKLGPVGKLASLHPEHVWAFSMLGQDRGEWWAQETLKRDQDSFDMHIYNDFTWYGQLEVMENIFQQFAKVLKRKNASYKEVWPELEGLAFVLLRGFIDFTMVDDSVKAGKVIEMIGFVTISTMEFLKEQGVLTPDPEIPNIGLVLGILVKWTWEFTRDYANWADNATWVYHVLDLAEESGLRVPDTYGFAEVLHAIRSSPTPKASVMKRWKKFKFASKVTSMVGGDRYDITTMPAAERKKHSFA